MDIFSRAGEFGMGCIGERTWYINEQLILTEVNTCIEGPKVLDEIKKGNKVVRRRRTNHPSISTAC